MDSIKVWDVGTGKPIGPEFAEYDKAQRVSRHTPCCSCSADGRYACTALGLWEDNKQPRLRIWDLNSGKLFQEINVGTDGYISGAVFAEKGRVLLAVDNAEWLHVFEVATGKSVESVRLRKQPKQRGVERLGDAAFSPDGLLLLTQGDGTTVQMWDTATRKPIWSDSVKGKN
jgi:WD40 repeat protein